jgi:uncharacterized protein
MSETISESAWPPEGVPPATGLEEPAATLTTPPAANPAPAGPVRSDERIQILDVIRGFALFGILQVNFLYFPGGFVGKFQDFVLDGKMRTIYSFLFGLGFAIQLIRAEESGRPFFLRYLWRTVLLLLIGSAHFVFIWWGDILREYALMAVMLLVVRRARPWLLLTLAAAILLFRVSDVSNTLPGFASNANTAQPVFHRADPEHVNEVRVATQIHNDRVNLWRAQREQAEQDGGYFAGVRASAGLWLDGLRRTNLNVFLRNDLMVMFLLGLYVGRRRILHEPEKHRRLLWWALGVAGVIGFTGAFYNVFGALAKDYGLGAPDWVTDRVAYYIGNDCCAVFYICAVTLLFLGFRWWRGWATAFAAVGRMGLTNYLMHSVIMTTVLYARGLGLQPRAFTWWGIVILETVFIFQIFYSRWWLKRFQYGPVEWAWRSATWLRREPTRPRTEPAHVEPAPLPVAAGGA